MSSCTMISHYKLTRQGILPVKVPPVRFAVGPPDGLTSNSWRVWTSKIGDIYLKCRDSFKETKVSLHTSGRWRMGFTTEAVATSDKLLGRDQNRAWEVWDEPPKSLPETVEAFRLVFPPSELAVRPDQRKGKAWEKVIHIESAPPGKLTVITLFITREGLNLNHESEPNFCLACFDIGKGRTAQLIAHGEPDTGWPAFIDQAVAVGSADAESAGVKIPDEAFGYFFGRCPNGCRFLVGAKMKRPTQSPR